MEKLDFFCGTLKTEIDCKCGKKHSCEIERVLIRNGALSELPAMTENYKSILLVSDENTRIAAGFRVKELLSNKIESELVYKSEGFLIPDETAVSELEKALCTLISSTQGTESQEKTELSYEEVIDQWLNGKKS